MNLFVRTTFAILAVAAAGQASAQRPADAVPTAVAAPSETYILGSGDVIEVRVLGQQDFTTRARIREDGTIALPFLGDVRALGLSPVGFARDLSASLNRGGYYAKPIVNVEVVSYASRYVTILGAVAQSGLQPVDRDYRLSEILARAGGLRQDSSRAVIVRRDGGQEQKYDFDKVALGGDDNDPIVRSGDKIFAPIAEDFYVYGQVNAPGAYSLRDGLTLRNAIARSGGLTASGSDKKITIYRKGEKVKLAMEDKVQAGDTLVVGERFF